MINVSLKKFKQDTQIFLNRSRKNREPIFLESKPESFVVLPKDDYNSLIETLYLLQSEANAKWLTESIQQADNGQVIPVEKVNEKFGLDPKRA